MKSYDFRQSVKIQGVYVCVHVLSTLPTVARSMLISTVIELAVVVTYTPDLGYVVIKGFPDHGTLAA